MVATVHILSGGAAKGLVGALEARLLALHGHTVAGTFGAVGVMKDQLLAGAPCDVLILTDALITELTASGQLRPGSARALGRVKTGVAVKAGAAQPAIDSPAELKAALQAASAIYLPDPVKATAGIHVMNVLRQLGIAEEVADRLRPFPNGATAMREMATATGDGVIGCTQVTEILYTLGVQLVGPLPRAFELATVYTAAVCTRAGAPEAALQLIDLLAGADAAALRREGGFEPL